MENFQETGPLESVFNSVYELRKNRAELIKKGSGVALIHGAGLDEQKFDSYINEVLPTLRFFDVITVSDFAFLTTKFTPAYCFTDISEFEAVYIMKTQVMHLRVIMDVFDKKRFGLIRDALRLSTDKFLAEEIAEGMEGGAI